MRCQPNFRSLRERFDSSISSADDSCFFRLLRFPFVCHVTVILSRRCSCLPFTFIASRSSSQSVTFPFAPFFSPFFFSFHPPFPLFRLLLSRVSLLWFCSPTWPHLRLRWFVECMQRGRTSLKVCKINLSTFPCLISCLLSHLATTATRTLSAKIIPVYSCML